MNGKDVGNIAALLRTNKSLLEEEQTLLQQLINIFNPSINMLNAFHEDFITVTPNAALSLIFGARTWKYAVTGGATINPANQGDSTHVGVLELDTTVANGDDARIMMDKFFVLSPANKTTLELLINETLGDAASSCQASFGFSDFTGNNYILFDVIKSGAPAMWQLLTANGGVTTTVTTTVTEGSGWTKFKIEYDPSISRVNFYINDAIVGFITTNIPTAVQLGTVLQINNRALNAVGASMKIDSIDFNG